MNKIQEWSRSLTMVDSKLSEMEDAWVEAKAEIKAFSRPTLNTDTSKLVGAVAAMSSSIKDLKGRNAITNRFGVGIWTDEIHMEALLVSGLGPVRGTETDTSQLRRAAMCGLATLERIVEIQEGHEEDIGSSIHDIRRRYTDLTAIFYDKDVQAMLAAGTETRVLCDVMDRTRLWSEDIGEWRAAGQAKESMLKTHAGILALCDGMEFSVLSLMSSMSCLEANMGRQTILSDYYDGVCNGPVAANGLMRGMLKFLDGPVDKGEGSPSRKSTQRLITEFYKWNTPESEEGEPSEAGEEKEESSEAEEEQERGERAEDDGTLSEAESEANEILDDETGGGLRQESITSFFLRVSNDHAS